MIAAFKKIGWLWIAVSLAFLKLVLVRAQPIYAIGNAAHDERLFLQLAQHIVNGEWLGAYNELTLAKGPVYSVFVAANHLVGLPLGLTQHLLYLAACVLTVRALLPWLTSGWTKLGVFTVLWWNPLTYEGEHMTRILRQHLTIPFALVIAATLLALILRRDRPTRARLPWAITFGLVFGLFWMTREEGAWILSLTGVLGIAAFFDLFRGPMPKRRETGALLGAAIVACAIPMLTVCTLNYRHYGWFGTVEFRADDFRDAYGALTRVETGARYPYIAVSRETREAIYAVSPAFAELQPHLEGDIGTRWADSEKFAREERQIGSGWFMWALRDAVAAAGHATSAREALAYYRRLADEVNRAGDDGRLRAGQRRSGFFPLWHPAYTQALRNSGPSYLHTALSWPDLEPTPPFSIGTDDEVRIFRDITHERISPSLRATNIALPDQQRLDQRKLGLLRALGRSTVPPLFAFIIFAHLVAVIRCGELLWRREFSPIWFAAVGVWSGAAGELAVNLLVHTTSFLNFYPAAFAPAYPLMLLFALLATLDAAGAWRGVPVRIYAWLRARPAMVWAFGAGLIVFGARLREIHLHAGEVPFLDQWKIEAQQVLAPWLDGTLSFSALFAPHHEHVPVWNRVVTWLQAVLLGSWDPRWSMVFNATVHATWVVLITGWLRRHLAFWPGLIASVLILITAALPHAWENITWGFQLQFPLALLFSFLCVRGTIESPPFTRRWWGAQAAGAAGLFTLGSFWAAPLLLVLVQLWVKPRFRRELLSPLALAAAGACTLFLAIRTQPAAGALALHAAGVADFIHVWFFQSGWPSALPGAAVLLNLPLALLVWRTRGRSETLPFDRVLLVLGMWTIVQSAGLALARGAVGADFVSRYSDLFALGFALNAVIILRWAFAGNRLALLGGAVWLTVAIGGLHTVNSSGHTRYFHEHSAGRAAARREAVTGYLRTGDSSWLTSETARSLVYPDPATVTQLLDQPQFVALLPSTLRGQNSPGGAVLIARGWWLFLAVGLFLLTAGLRRATEPVTHATREPWAATRADAVMPGSMAALALGMLALWSMPFDFDQPRRWTKLIAPEATSALEFEFATPAGFPHERLVGAAGIGAEHLRNLFFGTSPDGPGFTGVVRSRPFVIGSDFLVVPVAGYPASAGNELTLAMEGESGATLRFADPNPGDIGFWTIDVRAHRGATARLWLRDGRTADEGWLAVAPPTPTDSPAAGPARQRAWDAERSSVARFTLMGFAAMGLIAAMSALLTSHRRE